MATDSYERCEKCGKGYYVPEKAITAGETWYFCNNCFRYHSKHDQQIRKNAKKKDEPSNNNDFWGNKYLPYSFLFHIL